MALERVRERRDAQIALVEQQVVLHDLHTQTKRRRRHRRLSRYRASKTQTRSGEPDLDLLVRQRQAHELLLHRGPVTVTGKKRESTGATMEACDADGGSESAHALISCDCCSRSCTTTRLMTTFLAKRMGKRSIDGVMSSWLDRRTVDASSAWPKGRRGDEATTRQRVNA